VPCSTDAETSERLRLIEGAKNTKDPKSRAEILDLAEAGLASSVGGPIWKGSLINPLSNSNNKCSRAKKER
jgi:hypothetical protein